MDSDNLRGALFMAISMAAFTLNDAMMKLATAELPLFTAIFLRGILASVLIAALAWSQGALTFRFSRGDRPFVALRTFAEAATTVCFLTALMHMPLANISAILQSLPLAVTFAAALFLGEKVGWRRWSAILIGFAGVMLIVRPGSEGFNIYAVLALVAVAFIVLRDMATRKLSPDVPSLSVALLASLAVTALGGVMSVGTPLPDLTLWSVGPLVLAALFLIAGYIFIILAMRVGDVAFVSPFRYTALVWAIGLGLLLFNEWPDAWTWAGSAIVVATGIFTFYREQSAARRARFGARPSVASR
ncbi:DMT family transporter [Oceanomicrobium pacificus]|uniref:EamA family transporter n=1 Tax=Oceanomicrobium pacificus TaxID=2692916 RepID=A0A6B0TZE8_9RHOB|nr:DMT family transporter [Oceanomicrobium pacificus]MXU66374.1 EamA family transporter [Oceanomicrobium pacificus]